MSLLSCQIEIPEEQGLKTNEISVGRKFLLNCEGDWSGKDLKGAEVQFATEPKANPYQMKILSAKVESDAKAIFTVTSYVPGDHQILNWKLVLANGQPVVEMPPVAFQVASVIKDPQSAKPFPPIGPLATGLPSELQMAFIGLVLAWVFTMIAIVVRIKVKSRERKRIKALDKNLSPALEFSSHQRSLKRDIQMRIYQNEQSPVTTQVYEEMLELLRAAWLTYLSREWGVYFLESSAERVLRRIKKSVSNEEFETWGEELAQVLFELERLKKNKVPRWQDILTLTDKSQEVAEAIDHSRQQNQTRAK